MENKAYNTEGPELRMAVQKIKVWFNRLLLIILGIVAIAVWQLSAIYDLAFALKTVLVLAFGFLPGVLVCACFAICEHYRYYHCKECGHIHKPEPKELGKENRSLYYCASCSKNTRHEIAHLPM